MAGIPRPAPRACLPLVWLTLAAACGSASEPQQPEAAKSAGAEARFAQPGMQVSGLMGTIPERKILATLEPKLPSFQRCFERGAERVGVIAGRMELYFRVGLDGHVEWVYPRASTVGHRETEQCVLEQAKTARFPGPKGGGAAELAWSFEIDGSDSVRPPVEWEPERVASVVREQRAALEACAAPGVVVTAYVAPGGQVMSAGASAATREGASHIDCVVAAVESWTLPDPGSYAAKVTFSLP